MEKINVAELLKDCPNGMELDCTMFDNVTFVKVDNNTRQFPIEILISGLHSKYLTKEGCFHDATLLPEAKCVIFPKGKTTWEGFVPPCKFKNGDIISNGDFVAIFYKIGTPCHCVSPNIVYYHCYYSPKWHNFKKGLDFGIGISTEFKYATEEEKEKLFDAIKANGYKWNAETKTLEKLIEPKFKVDDKIKLKGGDEFGIITQIADCYYTIKCKHNTYCWPIKKQDAWELVPNKFDISTLKPFESRVLVRNVDGDLWKPAIYGFPHSKGCYVVGGVYWGQCIPYEENKELLGTTNNPEEYGSR